MKVDKKLIKELVEYLEEFKLTELEYQDGEKKIKVSKGSKTTLESSKGSTVIPSNKAVLSSENTTTILTKLVMVNKMVGPSVIIVSTKIIFKAAPIWVSLSPFRLILKFEAANETFGSSKTMPTTKENTADFPKGSVWPLFACSESVN